jgi:hypothetical protein
MQRKFILVLSFKGGVNNGKVLALRRAGAVISQSERRAAMCKIGEFRETLVVEPIEEPLPLKEIPALPSGIEMEHVEPGELEKV